MDKSYKCPTARSRELRLNPTEPEKRLWQILSGRRLAGVRFNRQFPIGPFICDFVARSIKLVIELDGGQHASSTAYDTNRTTFLEQRGYRVIRFWNHDVLENIEGIMTLIKEALKDRPSPSPSRSAGGEEP